jgi:hypothetical protein
MTGIMMDLDLDTSPEAAEQPRLPAGWITVTLMNTEFRMKDDGEDEPKAHLSLEFRTPDDSAYPDVPIYAMTGWPLEVDTLIETKMRKKEDGGYMTRAEFKLSLLKIIATALGAHGLKLAPDMFIPYVGRQVSVKLDPDEYQGEVRNRIPYGFNFGRNIKPV